MQNEISVSPRSEETFCNFSYQKLAKCHEFARRFCIEILVSAVYDVLLQYKIKYLSSK